MHLLVRVHVLRRLRRRDGRASARTAAASSSARPRASCGVVSGARHLYVHLPFCAHRCGYCDFVTVVGRHGRARRLRRRAARASSSSSARCSRRGSRRVFLGGGTPTFTEPAALERLLARACRTRGEVTVEANPETVTPELAALLADSACQSRLARRAELPAPPARGARSRCRARRRPARRLSFFVMPDSTTSRSISSTGSRARAPPTSQRDLAEALALEPEHLSAYELEAKPGTRFTHAHGAELERQAESMESYFELVVETLTRAGYRWYETANFCRAACRTRAAATCARGTTSATGSGTTTSASAWARSAQSRTGAGGTRRRCRGYVAALAAGGRPPRELEELPAECARPSGSCSGCASTSRSSLAGLERGARRRRARAARAARARRAARRDAALTRARPLPRRRRHRAALLAVAAARPTMGADGRAALPSGSGRSCGASSRSTSRRAQPVGSKTLVERAGFDVSPSTVRAELAELERLGLLTHPHTSAGRVPTEAGLPRLRRRAARAPGAAPGRRSRSSSPRRAPRSRRRSRRRPRCSRR